MQVVGIISAKNNENNSYLSSGGISFGIHLLFLLVIALLNYLYPFVMPPIQPPIEVGLITSQTSLGQGDKSVGVKTKSVQKTKIAKVAKLVPETTKSRPIPSEKPVEDTAVSSRKAEQSLQSAPEPSPGGLSVDSVSVQAGNADAGSSAFTGSVMTEKKSYEGASSGTSFISGDRPLYPKEALKSGNEGVVVVRVTVDDAGLPSDVKILKSSGLSSFDQEALRTVKKWRFKPAKQHGRIVAGFHDVRVKFRIDQ
ncbi:MAG: TonB family protein [Geobacteraceae bacterium]|nr:TonB family protein [Geobacteraceae bacterium]